MFLYYFNAVAAGFALSATAVTNTLATLALSVRLGRRAAFLFVLGCLVSDALVVAVLVSGLSFLEQYPQSKTIFTGVGATLMLVFGLLLVFRNNKSLDPNAATKEVPTARFGFRYIVSGFLVNMLNPFMPPFWIGMVGTIAANSPYKGIYLGLFYVVLMVSILFFDTLKVLFADACRNLLKRVNFKLVFRGMGVMLVIIGLRALWLLFIVPE